MFGGSCVLCWSLSGVVCAIVPGSVVEPRSVCVHFTALAPYSQCGPLPTTCCLDSRWNGNGNKTASRCALIRPINQPSE
ncbi:hypothetical protein EDB84DRAFT_1485973 [Lactarius hengduanensis]|nr:hypothetical protein EDB84DRAFT_1485973 [Lactarius hengduanensis]